MSALTGSGMGELCDRIVEVLNCTLDRSGSRYLLSTRQRAALAGAGGALEACGRLLEAGEPTELAALELAAARAQLGAVTGEVLPDDILGSIFAGFCIGK